MSYEDIITIIFVAVQVVKKEVIVHRPKTSVGPIPSDTVKVGTRGSTLLVRVEDVVLRLHGRMARVSAV